LLIIIFLTCKWFIVLHNVQFFGTTVDIIYQPDLATEYKRPLFLASVAAGFPSPADDYIENQLDLNKQANKLFDDASDTQHVFDSAKVGETKTY